MSLSVWSGAPSGAYERSFTLEWRDLDEALAGPAAMLTCRAVTWDPLEMLPHRPSWFAVAGDVADQPALRLHLVGAGESVTGDDDAQRRLIGGLSGSILITAAAHLSAVTAGSYPWRARRGRVPDLLAERDRGGRLGLPEITAVAQWQPVTRQTVEDAVAARYGPIQLDRSPASFQAAPEPTGGCPACAETSLGFPEGLEEVLVDLCPAHRTQAAELLDRRLQAARESNPAAWAAVIEAEGRRPGPHLPAPMAALLTDAGAGRWPGGGFDHQGRLVIEALRTVSAETAAGALDAWPEQAHRWLQMLPGRLLDAGEDSLADELGGQLAALGAAQAAGSPPAPAAPERTRLPARRGASRNTLCACGSGRKYKHCHGHPTRRNQDVV